MHNIAESHIHAFAHSHYAHSCTHTLAQAQPRNLTHARNECIRHVHGARFLWWVKLTTSYPCPDLSYHSCEICCDPCRQQSSVCLELGDRRKCTPVAQGSKTWVSGTNLFVRTHAYVAPLPFIPSCTSLRVHRVSHVSVCLCTHSDHFIP